MTIIIEPFETRRSRWWQLSMHYHHRQDERWWWSSSRGWLLPHQDNVRHYSRFRSLKSAEAMCNHLTQAVYRKAVI